LSTDTENSITDSKAGIADMSGLGRSPAGALMDDWLLEYNMSDKESCTTTSQEGAGEMRGKRLEEHITSRQAMVGLNQDNISVQELIIWDCWRNWEEDLRQAHWECQMAQVISLLQFPWNVPGNQVGVRRLTAEEEERLGTWRRLYLYQPAGFEEERMADGAFGLGE